MSSGKKYVDPKRRKTVILEETESLHQATRTGEGSAAGAAGTSTIPRGGAAASSRGGRARSGRQERNPQQEDARDADEQGQNHAADGNEDGEFDQAGEQRSGVASDSAGGPGSGRGRGIQREFGRFGERGGRGRGRGGIRVSRDPGPGNVSGSGLVHGGTGFDAATEKLQREATSFRLWSANSSGGRCGNRIAIPPFTFGDRSPST